ncbi:hypothetical protein ACP4OV_018647 [Aristida adscensionis]
MDKEKQGVVRVAETDKSPRKSSSRPFPPPSHPASPRDRDGVTASRAVPRPAAPCPDGDAMDKDKQGVVRVAETDKSPRKSPRLELQPDVALPEEAASSDTSSGDCKHFGKIESLKYGPAPACEFCVLESSGGSADGTGQKDPHKQQLIMVRTQCDRCLCSGGATSLSCSLCVLCQSKADDRICTRCCSKIRSNLLVPGKKYLTKEARGKEAPGKEDSYGGFYCLACHKVVPRTHTVHKGKLIPLVSCNGKMSAWYKRTGSWAGLFDGIECDRDYHLGLGHAVRLFKPDTPRCKVCSDVISEDKLYGTLFRFCTIECYVNGAEGLAGKELFSKALVSTEFNDACDCFCLSCLKSFRHSEDDGHEGHECLAVILDYGLQKPAVEMGKTHRVAQHWTTIKHEDSGQGSNKTRIIFIRHEKAPRCQSCCKRLVDGGGINCCLECSLEPKKMVPRALQVRSAAGHFKGPYPFDDEQGNPRST